VAGVVVDPAGGQRGEVEQRAQQCPPGVGRQDAPVGEFDRVRQIGEVERVVQHRRVGGLPRVAGRDQLLPRYRHR
jgi:hypothetical protein